MALAGYCSAARHRSDRRTLCQWSGPAGSRPAGRVVSGGGGGASAAPGALVRQGHLGGAAVVVAAPGNALAGAGLYRPGAVASRLADYAEPGPARFDHGGHEWADSGHDRPRDPGAYRAATGTAGRDGGGPGVVQPGLRGAGLRVSALAAGRSVAVGNRLVTGAGHLCLALCADAGRATGGWSPGLTAPATSRISKCAKPLLMQRHAACPLMSACLCFVHGWPYRSLLPSTGEADENRISGSSGRRYRSQFRY